MTEQTTKGSLTARRLANALERTISGPMWHGPALGEAVAGLTAAQAAARPVDGAHSIWELVLHIAAWADIAGERLANREEPVRPERNFPPTGEVDEARWAEAIAQMQRSYKALATATRAVDETTLFANLANHDHSAWATLQGVVEHGTYHGGQIALLRRALGIEPPKS
jgi:uncharacterized damage-inducible protein DinB